MRKSRLKILPARCLAQLGFLLLYLACPILGEMSRAQPDHGLASSLTLHVLEHCSSPPKDPGDGSCFSVPKDVKMMTRNENGHATCSVATHLLNLATKCAPEEQPNSMQSSKITTVTLVPRRLLAARSKLPASIQEPTKSFPKRQFRHRSLKRDSNTILRDSSMIAEQNLVHSEREVSRRSTNVVRRSVEERRNMRTEVTRTTSRIGSDNFRGIRSERLNSRNLNRDTSRSAYSRDSNNAFQGESRRLRRLSYSRVASADIRSKFESSERSADKGRRSSSLAERRAHESRVADQRSRHMDVRRISLPASTERRMDSRAAVYETRRFSVERNSVHTGINERRGSPSRISTLNSSSDRNYRKSSVERRLSDSRATEIETRKSSQRLASQGSRNTAREQLSQRRLAEIRLQNDEPRRSLTDMKLHERRSSEAKTRELRAISLGARQTVTVRQRISPDRLSFRSLISDRESRRNSRERLSLQRSSTDRRLSESEGRVSAEQRKRLLGSPFEGRISALRNSREDARRRLSETRHSSSPIKERYDSSRRVLGITRERKALGMSRQTLLRRVSDERTATRNRDGEVISRLIRENNIISATRRARRSISLDRTDNNRAYFTRERRSLSMMNDRRVSSTTATPSVSGMNRIRNIASGSQTAEVRISESSRQQGLSTRRDMEGRNRAVLRELSLSEVRERVRNSRESRIESPARLSRRTRSLEERSASRRTFTMERREMSRTRDQNRAVERLSRDVALMERRDIRRAVSDRSFRDRRFTFRATSRSSDPMLASRRTERRGTMLERSSLEAFNSRIHSLERENRRAIAYGSTRRGTLEGRISREDSLGFLRSRRAESVRNAGRRISTIRTADVRDSTRALNEHNISRLSRRTSTEKQISADRRNTRRLSAFRSTEVQDFRVTMVDSTRHQNTPRRLEQNYHNVRSMRVRSVERESNYRIASVSVGREERQNVWVTGRRSQRDDRFNRQLKATSAGHFLRRNVRAVSLDAMRRQSTNRQNALTLRELRTTQDGIHQNHRYSRSSEQREDRRYMLSADRIHQNHRYSRSSEQREDRRYMLSADRKNNLRDVRQSADRVMSTVQYGRRATDSLRITRSSKSRNYVLTRERREYSNYVRFNRRSVSSQESIRKSQRYEISAFRKLAVHDNRLIASKTDNYRTPEITAKNVTAKTDMVREAKLEEFNKHAPSWLKDLTTTCSMKWHTGVLWQQFFLILAALSWTKTGCIDTITNKVSGYLFASENMDIIGATKIAASNDRDNLLGTVIGGGAAAAALLLFSTRTK